MAVYRLLERDASFGPEAINAMTEAYEGVLRTLKLIDRSDPVTRIIARTIFDAALTGLRDPALIETSVLKELR
jgi:hypothetical protein